MPWEYKCATSDVANKWLSPTSTNPTTSLNCEMNPSASAIRDAVEKLKKSPGVFQRLAERYAQAIFPQRFRELVPKGRNPEDVAVKGWPDAYAVLHDGRLDAIEATHSPDWERHLNQDCEKAKKLGPGRLAGFLFVAWASTPSTEKVNECRDRFVKLGVPADRVKFVFRDELVAALTRPQFADLWVELLGLRCDSLPFHPIRRVKRLFGREDQIATFAPTMADYVDGRVHRSRLADEVERQLQHPGWAFVRGLGAAGKTVLATQTALGSMFSASPAYYCDLVSVGSDGADATASAALEAITTRADDGVLFVLDNVHVNESFARTLFDHWETFPNGSRMLLLGRWVSAGADLKGRANSLDDLEGNALVLQVAPEDLEGVYLRLAQRRSRDSTGIQPPSTDVLQGWSRLFGGDLIAFSAAVARRIDGLLRGQLQLRPEDAIDYVHDVYLAPLTEVERRNLLIVATLSRIEFDTPVEAIEKGSLKMPLRQGVVHRTEHGRDVRVRFHLVHPGLGDLVLAAHGSKIDELTVFRHVAYAHPVDGQRLAGRLENLGRSTDAGEVLGTIAQSPRSLAESILLASLVGAHRHIERLAQLGACAQPQLDTYLVANEPLLVSSAYRTPLGDLASFLGYAERKLPQVHRQLSTALAEPDNLESLTETALRTPLGHLASFLRYAEGKLPHVYRQLSTALAEPDNLKSLTETALRTPLGHLASFLRYAEGKLPHVYRQLSTALAAPDNLKSLTETALRTPLVYWPRFLNYAEGKLPHVYRQLSASLAEPDNLKSLTETALRTPLDHLANFLGYAEGKLPQVYRQLSASLADPDNQKSLTETALRTPLGNLASFLGYAEGKLPQVHRQLSTALAEPDNVKSLTQTALRTPLNDLASFLGYAGQKLEKVYGPLTGDLAQPANIKQLAKAACTCPLADLVALARVATFAPAVVEAIDLPDWELAWLQRQPGQPNFIGTIDRELRRLGRPELVIAPAQALIRAAEPSDWHSSVIGIVHLSHTLRLGRAVGEQEVHRFLDRVIDDAWLDQQYRDAIPGAIGAALLSIWAYHEQTVVSRFCRPTLASRIAELIKRLPTTTVEDTCHVLQLWGTSGVIGLDVAVNAVQWPTEARIGELIEFARPEDERLDYRSIQLWLGLRRMARFRSAPVAVPGTSGHQILALWKCATAETERQRRLNQWMIDWLERCAAADWHLLPDDSTLQ
jgi:hypothetical protein